MSGERIWQALSVEPESLSPSECDVENLWQRYFVRQRLLGQVVAGTMHPDDLLDCLSSDGLSVDGYLDRVDEALSSYVDL